MKSLYYINEQIISTFNWDDSLLKKLRKCCIVRIIYELKLYFRICVNWGDVEKYTSEYVDARM